MRPSQPVSKNTPRVRSVSESDKYDYSLYLDLDPDDLVDDGSDKSDEELHEGYPGEAYGINYDIFENITKYLDIEDMEALRMVNKSTKNIAENVRFENPTNVSADKIIEAGGLSKLITRTPFNLATFKNSINVLLDTEEQEEVGELKKLKKLFNVLKNDRAYLPVHESKKITLKLPNLLCVVDVEQELATDFLEDNKHGTERENQFDGCIPYFSNPGDNVNIECVFAFLARTPAALDYLIRKHNDGKLAELLPFPAKRDFIFVADFMFDPDFYREPWLVEHYRKCTVPIERSDTNLTFQINLYDDSRVLYKLLSSIKESGLPHCMRKNKVDLKMRRGMKMFNIYPSLSEVEFTNQELRENIVEYTRNIKSVLSKYEDVVDKLGGEVFLGDYCTSPLDTVPVPKCLQNRGHVYNVVVAEGSQSEMLFKNHSFGDFAKIKKISCLHLDPFIAARKDNEADFAKIKNITEDEAQEVFAKAQSYLKTQLSIALKSQNFEEIHVPFTLPSKGSSLSSRMASVGSNTNAGIGIMDADDLVSGKVFGSHVKKICLINSRIRKEDLSRFTSLAARNRNQEEILFCDNQTPRSIDRKILYTIETGRYRRYNNMGISL